MKCYRCGGYVEWKGPLTNLTHTECANCGGVNCQIVIEEEEPEVDLEFTYFCEWMTNNYVSKHKTEGQVMSLINSGTGKMLFEVWKGARTYTPH